MKNLIILSLATFISFNQAFAATTNGSASVKILPVIVLTPNTVLNFGSIAPTAIAGTVVINADNPAGLGTNVELISNGAAGTFSVSSGEPNAGYTAGLPSANVELTNSAGNIITVSNFNFIDGNSSRALSDTGEDDFSVGATLNVEANQAPGTYNGTYTVTANY